MKNIIEVINVTKKYDGFILDNINFTFQEGSIMGLIGPNGAGNRNGNSIVKMAVRKK